MSLIEEFSQTLKKRYQDWVIKKRRDPDDATARACFNEHRLLRDTFDYKDLDNELFNICLRESKLCFIILVLYMGNVVSTESSTLKCALISEFRKDERFRCLVNNVQLSAEHIELMVEMASKLTDPRPNATHMESVQLCMQYARDWIHSSDMNPILNSSTITYSMLTKSVKQIVGSGFFKSLRPPEKHDQDYFKETLADWLMKNADKILDNIEVGNIRETRLSEEVRLILRCIVRKLQELHRKCFLCKRFTVHDIYLGNKLEVQVPEVKLTRGMSFFSDFKSLKRLIEDILEYATPPSSPCPKDVKHFMDLIDKADELKRDALYMHPVVWSDCEVIKNVYLITGIHHSSSVGFQKELCDKAASISSSCPNWELQIPSDTLHKKFLDSDWASIRHNMNLPLKILYYMRDACSHLHELENPRKRCLYNTERELFAIFPLYLAELVEKTCSMKEFSGLYLVHAVENKKNELGFSSGTSAPMESFNQG